MKRGHYGLINKSPCRGYGKNYVKILLNLEITWTKLCGLIRIFDKRPKSKYNGLKCYDKKIL
ncbi:MAG: hypothetical protein N2327_06625 [Caldimicrobium sp.]|nr:hypothetical protein [Caldimicrobium sp.]